MQAGGGEAEDDVAVPHGLAGDGFAAFDGADGKAGQIVVAVGVHARHLGGLAADEGAAGVAAALGDAGDDGRAGGDLELAAGEIVEEEERLGPLHDQVVHAHRDEIDADAVMLVGGDRELQFRADPVGGRHQDGIAVSGRFRIEEGPEAAEGRRGAAAHGRARQGLDGLDQRIAGVDVDPGGFVGQAVYGVLPDDAL